ncbi:uncharacterized protein LOC142463647 [Ascaphus truei]|uniref:uncharacterized protein LOC142463647 n=1 Tax=Ascaphus truei TaxID=8439 RepID=UPI003F599049
MWDTIVIGVNACGNHVRDKRNCHKRFDDIRSKLKKKIQHQRVHATGTGGGPTPQRLILSPLEELLRAKLLPVVVEGLPGDRDIGIYPSQFPPVAPGGHVSPETEQVSSPGSASSTHLEEHDEEDYDDDDDAAAIDTQIQASDHEEVPIETVLPPNRPANTTYDAIVASEGKIVEAENRRHSDLMTVLERMIALQEETVSQLAHLHRVFIEVPKQLQKINTSFEALVVQQTQANYLRMTNVPQFNLNTSQAGSVHAGQFSPHASDLHSPGPNVTGQVADIAVQVPDDILPLPSVQIQQLTPTKEATKSKHKQLLLTSFWSKTTKDTHETDQPSLVQCLPTCSHVSVGTSPVGDSLPKNPVGESLAKSPQKHSNCIIQNLHNVSKYTEMASTKTLRKKTQPVSNYFKNKEAARADIPESSVQTASADPELDSSPEEPDNMAVMRCKNMKEFCSNMKQFFKSELWALRKDVDALGERTAALESRADETATTTVQTQTQISTLKAQITSLEDKNEDAENRDRRCNIRLRGVPESITDPEEFTSRWLEHLFPDMAARDLVLDRCHQALRGRPQQGDPPRDVVLRFHCYRTKEETCRIARELKVVEFEQIKFQVYQICHGHARKKESISPRYQNTA